MSRLFEPKAQTDRPPARAGRAVLQRKLVIGAGNDPLEREADRLADRALAAPMRGDFTNVPVSVQRHAMSRASGPAAAPPSVNRALAMPGSPLEASLRRDMEARFGHDFTQVRVHRGGAAERSAAAVSARAYTVRGDIVFGAGQFAPQTGEGRLLLAHELAHVVQQGAGVVDASVVQRALAPPLDKVETLLSYDILDWAITDSDAMEALALLGTIPPENLAASLQQLGTKYVSRLLDNLPDAARTGDVYTRVIGAMGSAGVMPYAQDQLSYGVFDWAITDAEVTRIFNMFQTLPRAEGEQFLADLDAAGKFGRLISNATLGHHALYIRPWIAGLTRGALSDRHRALLRTIVRESDDDALETLKLATATRFDVTVDKRPVDFGTPVEWEAGSLRQTYLVLDALPEAHVAKNKELLHLSQYDLPPVVTTERQGEQVTQKTSSTAGVYYHGRELLTINKSSIGDLPGTIRHETAHGVDRQLGWTLSDEPKKPERGGWKSYGQNFADCAAEMADDSGGGIKAVLAPEQRTDVVAQMASAMSNHAPATLVGNIQGLPWFGTLKEPDKKKVVEDRALPAIAIGLDAPWFNGVEGGEHLGPHVYEESSVSPVAWVRYEHQARVRKVHPYQFSSPFDWFAEAYRVYYTADPRGKGALLGDHDPDTKLYFDTVVDKLPASR